MENLFTGLKLEVNSNLYLKDPESSDLGKKIVEKSICLIDELGFDNFTFKKLGVEIGSNESSIYRYFENKHKLLLYLTSWFWAWKEYHLVFATQNILDSQEKLSRALEVITGIVEKDSLTSHIDEVVLNRVVVNEFSKSYLTKEIDKENREGYFAVYNRFVTRLKVMILAVKEDYNHSASLASTIVEGSLHQHFLKEHFPSLTECDRKNSSTQFFKDLVFSTLKCKNNG